MGSTRPGPRSPTMAMGPEMAKAERKSGENSGKWWLYGGKCWKILIFWYRRSEKVLNSESEVQLAMSLKSKCFLLLGMMMPTNCQVTDVTQGWCLTKSPQLCELVCVKWDMEGVLLASFWVAMDDMNFTNFWDLSILDQVSGFGVHTLALEKIENSSCTWLHEVRTRVEMRGSSGLQRRKNPAIGFDVVFFPLIPLQPPLIIGDLPSGELT